MFEETIKEGCRALLLPYIWPLKTIPTGKQRPQDLQLRIALDFY